MTPNKEDYLKEIGKLGGGDNLVSNKQIADALQVSPASVSEMLLKLERDGFIEYEPYRGIRLTQTGKQQSAALLRSHRLWEVFLLRHLGYSWSEVHEDAELLEHVTSPRLAQRLDDFLNHPDFCPHGSAIPHADGEIKVMPLRKLSQMSVGEGSVIRRVSEEKELLEYLQELGVQIGSAFTVRSIGPYEGPIAIEMDGRPVSLSYKAACHIDVDAG
ncbi:Cro/Cl family transcriptional regulator [Ruminococcaceae bacterium BL-6]|nr:Cro/Cl family transcriptional regulator [Ruminococcaceae bacterium BL-6]